MNALSFFSSLYSRMPPERVQGPRRFPGYVVTLNHLLFVFKFDVEFEDFVAFAAVKSVYVLWFVLRNEHG